VRLDVSNRFSNRPVRLGNSHAASPPVRSVQTTGISFFSFWGETRRLVVTVERLINDLQSQSLFRCNSCTLFRLQYAPRGISYIRRLNKLKSFRPLERCAALDCVCQRVNMSTVVTNLRTTSCFLYSFPRIDIPPVDWIRRSFFQSRARLPAFRRHISHPFGHGNLNLGCLDIGELRN
jgi:hypothetical protein